MSLPKPTAANPYAPPRAAVEAPPPQNCWREGKILVLRPGSALPARCVKCNAPATQPMRERRIYWHHPALLLLYLIVAVIVRKSAKVAIGICPDHQFRRRMFLAVGWGGVALCTLAGFVGASANRGELIAFGILGALLAIIVGMVGSRIAYPARITKEEIRLKGCGAPFLDSLQSR